MNVASIKNIFACLLICGWLPMVGFAQPIVSSSLATTATLGAAPTEPSGKPGDIIIPNNQSSVLLPPEPPVSPAIRSSVVAFYENVFLPALSVPIDWTGDASTCDAGTTSQAYLDASFDMINYYRAMVELPPVVNDTAINTGSQEAALMMSVNNSLSHFPPLNWQCYTPDGATAASKSNIALGAAGPSAITLYIRDPGASNTPIGHRRWILHPPRATFGIGSVGGGTRSANVLWVFAGTTSRPASDIIGWPPRGFVPYQVVYPRWSFSLNTEPGADYSSAAVSMSEEGMPVTLKIISNSETRFGDNTLVWEPAGLSFFAGQGDRVFDIEISNVGNADQDVYSYQVTVIDPAMVVVEAAIFANSFE